MLVRVAPNPMRELGLVMKMGAITAVQAKSPAKAAGIKPGDQITGIDGGPVGDPMSLPYRLDHQAGKTIEITLIRKGETKPVTLKVTLREPIEIPPAEHPNDQTAVSSLGIAYHVLNEVAEVKPGSPAAKAGLRPGDVMIRAVAILRPRTCCKN